MMMWRTFFMVAALAASVPAEAGEGRDLCPDRPGLGTPACTVDEGDIVLELGIGDWTSDRSGPERVDIVLAGDALLRVGLTSSAGCASATGRWGQGRRGHKPVM